MKKTLAAIGDIALITLLLGTILLVLIAIVNISLAMLMWDWSTAFTLVAEPLIIRICYFTGFIAGVSMYAFTK